MLLTKETAKEWWPELDIKLNLVRVLPITEMDGNCILLYPVGEATDSSFTRTTDYKEALVPPRKFRLVPAGEGEESTTCPICGGNRRYPRRLLDEDVFCGPNRTFPVVSTAHVRMFIAFLSVALRASEDTEERAETLRILKCIHGKCIENGWDSIATYVKDMLARSIRGR